MPVVKHNFVSLIADDPDATLVRPSDWNDDHAVSYSVHNVTGADTIALTDDVVRFQTGTYAVTLAAATGSGKQIYVCQDGAGTITVNPTGGDTIAGQGSLVFGAVGFACVLVDEAAGTWGAVESSFPNTSTTLASSYAAGTVAADQTLSLLDAKGGKIIVDGTSVSFTGANALQLLMTAVNTAGLRAPLGVSATFAPTSGTGTFHGVDLAYTINQTGGANGTVTGVFLNATETAVVGAHNLLDLQVGGVSRFATSRYGQTTISSPAGAVVTGPLLGISYANTGNLAASTEIPGIKLTTAIKTWAAGAITNQREVLLTPPVYGFASASTIANAALLALPGMPGPGPNATITNAYALFVVGGTLTPTAGVRILVGNNTATDTIFQPASGSASFYGLNLAYEFDPTNTSGTIAGIRLDATNLGSNGTLATSYLVQVRNNSTNVILVRDYGSTTISQLALSGLSAFPLLQLIAAAHTGLPAGTEFVNGNFNFSVTKTWAAGTITTQREMLVFAPTYAFNSSSQIVNSATFAISGAPIAGANCGLQQTAALWVQSGGTVLNGAVSINGGMNIGSPTNLPPGVLLLNGTISTNNTTWNGLSYTLGTFTYTGGSTTIAQLVATQIQGGALAATNATTVTDFFTVHIGAGLLTSGNMTVTRNWSLLVDGNVQIGGAQEWHTTVMSSTPYTVLTPNGSQQGDHVIFDTLSSSSASTVNLPSIATVGSGYILIILDAGYTAATAGRNISVVRNGTDRINNVAANITMATNGQSLRLISNNNVSPANWMIW